MNEHMKIFCISFLMLLTASLSFGQVVKSEDGSPDNRPNILFMIADDMSMKDWRSYGGEFAKTPNIDKLAEEGVQFNNAYCGSTVCHPARSVLLTGQDIWRLRDAAVFAGTLHQDFETYPDMLSKSGYEIAHQGKGWGPGWLSADDPRKPLTGKAVVLSQFLKNKSQDEPFCFWWGTILGHREFNYEPDGRDLSTIELPPYTPDTEEVRKDYAGYYQEVEAFDTEVGKVVAMLEETGLAENTILVITSDHGQPWPRGKGSLYDLGTRVPLIVRWPARVKEGRIVDDFVNFNDFAPTFLDVAGLEATEDMTGQSLLSILESDKSGTVEAQRDKVYLGLESHPMTGPFDQWLGYMSCRSIRTREYLYIRNYSRKDHEGWNPVQAGPIVDIMRRQMQTDDAIRDDFNLCFGLRPEEELYEIKSDPYQVRNLANDPQFAETKEALKQNLFAYMKKTEDPRAMGRGDIFQGYPVGGGWWNGKLKGHNRFGALETFDRSQYSEWMKVNFPEPSKILKD
jgi:arylsulfatase A-like enzyme